MKNAYFIFTRSRIGLDNGVWLSMLTVLLISIFILGFKAITYVKCEDFEIFATGIQEAKNIFYVGETITISASVQSQDKPVWNFGDGSPLQNGNNIIKHSFLKEGSYSIICTVNHKCEQSLEINIVATPSKAKALPEFTGDAIIGVDTVYAGGIGHFTTPVKANYSYQWSVATSPDIPVQTTAAVDFSFYKEGQQILQLTIDGNKSYSKTITVLQKKSNSNTITNAGSGTSVPTAMKIPPAISFIDPSSGMQATNITINGSFFSGAKFVSFGGQPAKIISVSATQIIAQVGNGATGPVVVTTENGSTTFSNPQFTYIAPATAATSPQSSITAPPEKHKIGITDKQLKLMLQQVVNNTMHAPDFDRYFCSGSNILVYTNNDKAPVKLTDLCNKIQGKKISIESAHIVQDPDSKDCESNLIVKYKKTGGFLGL